mmetsp:Transcript_4248/g.6974  ORF Transcript_4248/g.6974 Transcript_4248/m.6974 type:complete len:147 (+) Transcript_4248:3034-3474(+)
MCLYLCISVCVYLFRGLHVVSRCVFACSLVCVNLSISCIFFSIGVGFYSVLELPCPLDEKLDAFKGMLTVLHKNPQVILSNKTNFYAFLATCSAWQSPPQEPIASGLREVIMKVKEQNPTMWDRVLNKFSNTYPVGALVQLYQLPL